MWPQESHLLVRLIRKNDFNLLGSIKTGLWSNGKRSCGLIKSDLPYSKAMGVSGREGKCMKGCTLSCIVPTVQTSGGSVMIWGCINWSGLGSASLCGNKMKSAEHLNVLNDQVILSMDFFFPDGTGIFQDENVKNHQA